MSDCKAQKPWKDLADCWEAIAKRHKKTIAAQQEEIESLRKELKEHIDAFNDLYEKTEGV